MCGTVGYILSLQLLEPVLLLGKERFAGVDIRVRVKGGGRVAQVYGQQEHLSHRLIDCKHVFNRATCVLFFAAIRQAISKALVAYYQKCELPWLLSWNVKWWTLGTHS